MRRLIRIVATFMLLVGLLGPTAFRAAAQDDPTGSRGEEGTPTSGESESGEGTYVSPTYGYSISYDDSWTLDQDDTEGGYDLLKLDSDGSTFYLEGYPDYDGDPETCLDEQIELTEQDPSVDDFEIIEDENGDPIESRSADQAFALVQVSVTTDDGETGDLVIYLECRPLIPDVAVIVISQYMSPSGYEDELERKDDIVDTLELGEDSGNDPQNNGNNSGSDEQKMLDLLEATETDVDDYWTAFFDVNNLDPYEAPTYVNFTSSVETACGTIAPNEVGPFYCGPDKTVYFDVEWMLQELEPYGDFIISVVVAHEVGHHVQELLGIDKCDVTQCLNGYTSLQIELMADCFAGSWAQLAHERGQLAEGDVENAIVALSEFLGDPANTDSADPSAHGPGSLRTWWFLRGYYETASACFQQPEN
ncbi:hypothetical protein BH09CHL1_BH09CHL1_14690 [soil metagenome]